MRSRPKRWLLAALSAALLIVLLLASRTRRSADEYRLPGAASQPAGLLQITSSSSDRKPKPGATAADAVQDARKVAGCAPAEADAHGRRVERSPADKAADDALRRALDVALGARTTERAAAARYFIAMVIGGADAATEQEQAGINCSEVSCWQGIDAAQATPRFALARLALRTSDPAVYAAALQACGLKREQDCELISARQWARLEPHNAVPWLHVADEAAARNDPSGVAEALYQVARASSSDNHATVLVREALDALPEAAGPQSEGRLARLLMGVQSTSPGPPLGAAARYCSAEGTRDANRMQLCVAVADTLLTHAGTLAEHSIALLIGRRSGWPADKVAAVEAERDAMRYAVQHEGDAEGSASACELGRIANRVTGVFADRGEIGVLREAVRSSGRSVAELAATLRTERLAAQREREATSALAPAGTPP